MEAAINWDVSPIIFEIGFLKLRWYGLLFALGFVIGYYIIEWIFKIEKKPMKDLEALTFTMVLSTVLGARFGHCFFYDFDYYMSNPLEILMIWKGGLASHGAAVGILLGLWIFVNKRKDKFSYLWILDRIGIVIALAASFIRLGNLFNSEILGKPADLEWSFAFPVINDLTPRHPTQIYESISYLVIFIFLFSIYRNKKQDVKPGLLFGLFLMLVFGMRFLIEFIKEDQSAFEAGMILNMGQILSIPLIIGGIFLTFFHKK